MPKAKKLKVTKVKASIVNSKVQLELPMYLGKYLNLDRNNRLFAVPINGVLQLCAVAPNIAIPVSNVTEDDFATQT